MSKPSCEFGYDIREDVALLEKTLVTHCKEESKKINDFLTWMNVMRDKKFPDYEKDIREAKQMSEEAKNTAKKAEKSFNRMVIAVVLCVLGLIATNIFNQFWTSSKMDQLQIVLKELK